MVKNQQIITNLKESRHSTKSILFRNTWIKKNKIEERAKWFAVVALGQQVE